MCKDYKQELEKLNQIDAYYLEKIRALLEEFGKVIWDWQQEYLDDYNCIPFTSRCVDGKGGFSSGIISIANMSVSFQNKGTNDTHDKVYPATLGFNIGSFDSNRMLILKRYPRLNDENKLTFRDTILEIQEQGELK